MSSHYDLQGLRTDNRKRLDMAATFDLIMSRLNALEVYAGQGKSSWYGTDPVTNVLYGSPLIAEWPHLRITYPGAASRAYIRDRVDQLRQLIGAPSFPWAYTPSKSDFDAEPYLRCGVDARGWLEMLQAIGRPNQSNQLYHHYVRQTKDGVVTEWTQPDMAFAGADYTYDYNFRESNAYGQIMASAGENANGGTFNSETGTYGPNEIRISNLTITNHWSVPVSGGGGSLERDWVEDAGGEKVMVLGGSISGGGEPEIVGDYIYNWAEVISEQLDCYGGYTENNLTNHQTIHAKINTLDNPTGGSLYWRNFTPSFTVEPGGSVYPVEYTYSHVMGSDGTPRSLSTLLSLIDPETGRGHVSIDHLTNLYQHDLGEDLWSWQGSASYYGAVETGTRCIIGTRYYRETGSSGWLLWTAPYLPEGWPESLRA